MWGPPPLLVAPSQPGRTSLRSTPDRLSVWLKQHRELLWALSKLLVALSKLLVAQWVVQHWAPHEALQPHQGLLWVPLKTPETQWEVPLWMS
jgi:hypothetical protein